MQQKVKTGALIWLSYVKREGKGLVQLEIYDCYEHNVILRLTADEADRLASRLFKLAVIAQNDEKQEQQRSSEHD